MRVARLFLLQLVALAAVVMAEEPAEKQINENATALVQAFMNFPDSYIGGVPMKDRGEFLSLVSHYGDIDFAKGYFNLRGDGARAHDSPASKFFSMKLYSRKGKLPLCVVAPGPNRDATEPPISFVSFEQYWRWSDLTKKFMPEGLDPNQPWYFRLNPDSNEIIAGLKQTYTAYDREFQTYGPMKGKLVWRNEQFSFEPFDPSTFFKSATLEVPPPFFADIPLDQRKRFWESIENDPERFDLANGWLHYFSDGRDISATSMLWAKVLQRSKGEPYLFVHMAKPFADSKPPRDNQTYVLRKDGNGWKDITKFVIPRKMDLTDHYRTRRDRTIEVGSWKEFIRPDGLGKTWTFGSRKVDLKWRISSFQESKAASDTFTKN